MGTGSPVTVVDLTVIAAVAAALVVLAWFFFAPWSDGRQLDLRRQHRPGSPASPSTTSKWSPDKENKA